MESTIGLLTGLVGFDSTATLERRLSVSLRSCNCFASTSIEKIANPVRLPSGWARLSASLNPTGSPEIETIGMVLVACFRATLVGVLQVMTTSGLKGNNSALLCGYFFF